MGKRGFNIEVREHSIRIEFNYNGTTVRERFTLNGKSLPPTPPNVAYAKRTADTIRQRLSAGTFRFEDFFPDSPRAKVEDEQKETFGRLADLWHESQGRLAGSTKDQYGTAVRFWKRLLGDQRLIVDITHKFLAAKVGGYAWKSAKQHNNYLIALRGVFDLEYRGPASVHNPMIGIENMTVTRKLPDPLTIDERDAILADIAKHYDERVLAYFTFAFYTGMRPEEIIALRWSDISYLDDSPVARVQRVRTFRGSEIDDTKTHVVRDVDLVQQAVDALAIMKPHTYLLRTKRAGDEDDAADIFQSPTTRAAWHDERSQRDTYWKPCLKRLGVRWRRPYNTRHTFATVALMKGVPPAYIAAQLGHSIKMLLEKYARWIPANDGGAARALLASAMGSSPPRGPRKAEGPT